MREALDAFARVVEEHGVKRVFALFSGGRDSLVALHLACRVVGAERVVAVHVDTTVSTPGNLGYVRSVCEELGVRLSVVRPRRGFFELVDRWGFPTSTRRWCCYNLKIEPLKRYFKSVDRTGGLVVDGMRAEESPRRRGFPRLGRRFGLLCYHPIFDWTKQDVLRYIAEHSLPVNPLYKVFPRATECWCTAFKSPKQFKTLKQTHPEFFKKFVEAEARLRTGGSALFKKGRRIYLRDL